MATRCAYLRVVDEAIAWRNANARDKEIWITECGYDACTPEAMKRRWDWFLKLDWQGHTDLQQAQYLVRSFLAFAERDVQRAYIYFFDDNDSPSVHGCAGLTRKFVPKISFWAVKQLYELLGEYRFKRVVKKEQAELFVCEFEHATNPRRVIWIVWLPTGTRTNEKDHYTPREIGATVAGLPQLPVWAVGMATAEGQAPQTPWETVIPAAIASAIGENPTFLIMEPAPIRR